ncbi:MAG TPA: methyltransferase domain-containing protein [Terriglobales bacterium]|nr:methyltransferase domain-containing protein [Terriglobales bacterium]
MREVRRLSLCLFVLFLATLPVHAQTSAPAASRKTSTPYRGDLTIFDSPGRDERLQINRVMDILSIHPGTTVADIGAGSGWFTVRAARRVGDTGEVYAVDINHEAITYINRRAQKEGAHNVKTILSKPDDALLPPQSVNSVLLLKTYHEVAHPIVLMRNLRTSLTPDARIGIIDRNGSGEDHGVDSKVVIQEMSEAGYELVEKEDFVKADQMDYFLVFRVKK